MPSAKPSGKIKQRMPILTRMSKFQHPYAAELRPATVPYLDALKSLNAHFKKTLGNPQFQNERFRISPMRLEHTLYKEDVEEPKIKGIDLKPTSGRTWFNRNMKELLMDALVRRVSVFGAIPSDAYSKRFIKGKDKQLPNFVEFGIEDVKDHILEGYGSRLYFRDDWKFIPKLSTDTEQSFNSWTGEKAALHKVPIEKVIASTLLLQMAHLGTLHLIMPKPDQMRSVPWFKG